MKASFLLILFLLLSINSCKIKSETAKECDVETLMDKNKYSRIRNYKVSNPESQVDKDQVTQLAFECIYIQAMPKVIYDTFGPWTSNIQIKNQRYPILDWE
jgi:hypothetical protein